MRHSPAGPDDDGIISTRHAWYADAGAKGPHSLLICATPPSRRGMHFSCEMHPSLHA
jgi:hypothetical protein